ncbi:LysR family transcriptional regulator [Thaumasiovibrio sp. DFM-14]|uniref:LysR family transcriptional regulator n=1 Tax=Thaumasiovibrio sp. DFM-14 TaxID=3384792 RepID=UPI0039A0E80A
MFSYELLAAFCATYEEQSYSSAAKKLDKDRTTVREQVKAIEDIYAIKLFDVIGKKVKPNAAAEHIYAHSKHIVNSTDKLNRTFESIYSENTLELTIYHDASLSRLLAIKIEQSIARDFPHLKTHWIQEKRAKSFDLIKNSQASIAFMPHNTASHFPPKEIAFCHLGYSQLGFYVGRRSKLKYLSNLLIEDLTLEKQYVLEDNVDFATKLFSISSQCHIISSNDMLIEMVKYDGWGVINTELALPHVRQGELFEVEVEEITNRSALGLSLFYPIALQEDPIVKLIRTISQDHFSHLGDK